MKKKQNCDYQGNLVKKSIAVKGNRAIVSLDKQEYGSSQVSELGKQLFSC
jgi:hypothetical protein